MKEGLGWRGGEGLGLSLVVAPAGSPDNSFRGRVLLSKLPEDAGVEDSGAARMHLCAGRTRTIDETRWSGCFFDSCVFHYK